MAAEDVAYRVNIEETTTFSMKARVNQELMATADTVFHMNCYEPGQITPMHKHPYEDEVLYIVEGAGIIQFEDKSDLPFEAGDLVCLPSDQYHSIHAALNGRTKLLYFMRPNYKSVRRQGPQPFPDIQRLPGESRKKQ